jgi:hypothetical protein
MRWDRKILLYSCVIIGLSAFAWCPVCGQEQLPPYYTPVTLPAQPLSWTPEVSADFGTLLGKLGATSRLDPASVRVTTAAGVSLPTRFVPEPGSDGQGLVRWEVPAAYGKDGMAEFRIYFAPASSIRWLPAYPEDVGPANLVANGGFERFISPDKVEDWVYYRGMKSITDPGMAHSGSTCMELKGIPDTTTGKTAAATMRTPGYIAIQGNSTYRLSYWLKAVGTVPGKYNLVSLVEVHWLAADKSLIIHRHANTVKEDTNWKELSCVLTAPENAHYMDATIKFIEGAQGAIYVDDLAVVPTQPWMLNSARTADETKEVGMGVETLSLRFDFTGDSAVACWPGFTPVTPASAYTKEAGYGWAGGAHPAAIIRTLPDAMARSLVVPAAGSCLVVDIPDGNYTAWFLIGDSGLGAMILPTYADWTIRIDGKEVLAYHPTAENWFKKVMFRNFDDWWEPGLDVYQRFIAPCFEEKMVPFSVKGGQVRFEINKVPICAMAVYSAQAGSAIEEELTRLRAARKRAVTVTFEKPPAETAQGITGDDRKRGYALFSRDSGRQVLPGSAPQSGEIIKEWFGFAAPGQYVSFTVSLYPLKEVGDVSVSQSDLVGSGQAKIKVDNVRDVGVIRYIEHCSSKSEYRYSIVPGPIQPRNPMHVPQGVTTSWVVRIAVPDDAAPGVYNGTFRISPSGAGSFNMPVALRVLPIRLEPTPISAGLYHFDHIFWYHAFWWKSFQADPWLREKAFSQEVKNFNLLKEYGMNALAFCEDGRTEIRVGTDGSVTFAENSPFTQWMDLYAKAGMGPMPWYGFSALGCSYIDKGIYGAKLKQFSPEWDRAYRSIIDWAKTSEKQRGWPEIIVYLSDELSNEGAPGAEKGRQLVQCTKDIPGIRTIASMNGSYEKVMLPGLDIAMPNHAFPITEQTLAETKQAGCDLWLYNIGDNRVMWGFYPWRVNARGRFQWFNNYDIMLPWNPFDGDSVYHYTRQSFDRQLPTLKIIAAREGIDDLRYIAALETVIEKAMHSGKSESIRRAEAARKELDGIRSSLPEDARILIGEISAKEAGATAYGDFSKSRYLDRLRWLIASHILDIQSALNR